MDGERIELSGAGGDPVHALHFAPTSRATEVDGADGGEDAAGLLLIHEVFGLDAFIERTAGRFAAEGFRVLVVDLYSRDGVPGPPSSADEPAPAWTGEQIRGAVASIPDRRALGDLEAGLEWLERQPGTDAERLAAIGFCMGGNYAFQLGCTSRRVAAVVDFYGRIQYPELSREKPIQPLELALNLTGPLLALFGDEDASIPLEQRERLRTTLESFAKSFEVRTFAGAGHGFFNDLRDGYHEGSAREAWECTLSFLRESLEFD